MPHEHPEACFRSPHCSCWWITVTFPAAVQSSAVQDTHRHQLYALQPYFMLEDSASNDTGEPAIYNSGAWLTSTATQQCSRTKHPLDDGQPHTRRRHQSWMLSAGDLLMSPLPWLPNDARAPSLRRPDRLRFTRKSDAVPARWTRLPESSLPSEDAAVRGLSTDVPPFLRSRCLAIFLSDRDRGFAGRATSRARASAAPSRTVRMPKSASATTIHSTSTTATMPCTMQRV